MNSIFHRVSIRKYLPQPIEQEKIEKMLRAAMAAPSACNQQPWEYYVVTNPEIIAQLSMATPYSRPCTNAPVVFVPCYRHVGRAPSYFHIDMSASVQNLLLEADELGLGAVWMGVAPQEDKMEIVRNILNVPEELSVFALVSCGYPAEGRPQQDRYEEERVHYVR